MRALRCEDGVQLVQAPPPMPGPGEALIRVLTAGICNTDLELSRGYMKYRGILGHEFVGIVETAPTSELVGRRVVGEINCVCHACVYCRMEMPHHCLNRSVLGILGRDGAFAEYVVLPEENLHVVPNGLRDDEAVFAEPVAAACRIPEQLTLLETDRIIVLGDGKLAQLIAQVLALYTKNLLVIGKHAWKLAKLNALKINTVLTSDPVERGADLVVEATGSPSGLARAFELVRPEGTVVLKTTSAHPTALDLSIPVVNEVRVVGSRCGPFRPALEALSMGNVEVRPLISETFELTDAEAAFERAKSGDVLKVLLHVSDG